MGTSHSSSARWDVLPSDVASLVVGELIASLERDPPPTPLSSSVHSVLLLLHALGVGGEERLAAGRRLYRAWRPWIRVRIGYELTGNGEPNTWVYRTAVVRKDGRYLCTDMGHRWRVNARDVIVRHETVVVWSRNRARILPIGCEVMLQSDAFHIMEVDAGSPDS